MKSRIIALACALTATACDATNSKPAPDPASDQVKSVDNTEINKRDRGSSTLTPMDQGNKGSETEISAAIRRGIMGDNDLSFTAKNVKVITVGTTVTLRGPVQNHQEKALIEALARHTAGVSEIDNQLEVKQ